MSICSFATLITVQNDLHPSVCTILCLGKENLMPDAPLVISPIPIMQAAESTTHCNHRDHVKHENVHTDIMTDNWASVDIA